jgi:hypothetical protein
VLAELLEQFEDVDRVTARPDAGSSAKTNLNSCCRSKV